MTQTALPLLLSPSFARADFVVSSCNKHALDLLDRWPDWPAYALILVGAAASGKTHLATLWQQHADAVSVTPDDTDIASYAEHPLLIDDADGWTGDAEKGLFHLLNQAKEHHTSLLLTACTSPASWQISLPDLVSRLNSLPQVVLNAPDDALLKAVLTKHFSDRQVQVEASVVDYIVARSERSLAHLQEVAEALDLLALRLRRPITIPLVKEWLETR